MNTDQNTPAASSLPPSDGGGADWADRAAEEIADLPDACLHIDESGSNGMGWHCKRLPESDLAAIIRKHAPTQQPAEKPEAGELGQGPEWAHRHDAHPPAPDTQEAVRRLHTLIKRLRYKDDHYNADIAELELMPFLATPRPESPDAQRGELEEWARKAWFAAKGAFDRKPVDCLWDDAAIAELTFQARALPAKGPGPRRLDPDLAMKVRLCANDAQGQELIAHAFAPPPASHSKQREGEQ